VQAVLEKVMRGASRALGIEPPNDDGLLPDEGMSDKDQEPETHRSKH
jgi:hypothetical protein